MNFETLFIPQLMLLFFPSSFVRVSRDSVESSTLPKMFRVKLLGKCVFISMLFHLAWMKKFTQYRDKTFPLNLSFAKLKID